MYRRSTSIECRDGRVVKSFTTRTPRVCGSHRSTPRSSSAMVLPQSLFSKILLRIQSCSKASDSSRGCAYVLRLYPVHIMSILIHAQINPPTYCRVVLLDEVDIIVEDRKRKSSQRFACSRHGSYSCIFLFGARPVVRGLSPPGEFRRIAVKRSRVYLEAFIYMQNISGLPVIVDKSSLYL